MAEVIRMPKMSDTMTEGIISSWLKKVGDTVKSGDVLAEVQTDKATMELENYEDGTLLYIGPKEGDAVPVDGVLAIIGKQGEDISGLLGGESAKAEKTEEKPAPKETAPKEAAKEEPKAPATSEKKEAKPAANVKATVIRMPKMSDTMTEGVIESWQKKVGDKVKSGDVLAEVQTDKATMDLESYEDGTLLYIGIEAGQAAPIDSILAIIGEEGADYKQLLGEGAQTSEKEGASGETKSESEIENALTDDKAQKGAESQPTQTTVPAGEHAAPAASEQGGRVKASPLAKKVAKEKGYNLSEIKGSGDNGRIVLRDVENFQPAAAAPKAQPQAAPAATTAAAPQGAAYEEIPVSQMRKIIAKRLAESKFSAPHFYLTMEIDMDKAVASRTSLNEISPVKISFNDMVIKAAAAALKQHPFVNSSWLGDKIRINKQINIGVAVAVEEGLLVPVVRNADQKTLSQIAGEVKDLGGKAKSKKLQPSDWEGNTFTISNLGMFGIEEFTAIINPPDACIMAVGAIKQIPVVKNGQIQIGNIMKVTLSCDHRVVDGAVGSAFLQTFKGLLEDPIRMLV
ncbi:pyruvate dehydrogenase complex dihydrolipoamide acetyltransferase [Adhaeribacter soli]|uniref:Acetyltransferase component of pyruvate dehydrogenase complex n=1 Tax=Adhaeribacter soli TaxID=2607655 RepID=A0A5N1J5L7_9BACT|nr:pyruvate dehydrogenase complex dihydrolipoamide acetyltransferase [Adhaeribacter soli]KAA9345994.1 pyruvate dehydrogenase complex dihydrolipoamide acetyltransferase [Adhaeribacter soli]